MIEPGYPGVPRWAKVFWAVLAIVGLVLIVLMLAGKGGHGPRRHGLLKSAPVTASVV